MPQVKEIHSNKVVLSLLKCERFARVNTALAALSFALCFVLVAAQVFLAVNDYIGCIHGCIATPSFFLFFDHPYLVAASFFIAILLCCFLFYLQLKHKGVISTVTTAVGLVSIALAMLWLINSTISFFILAHSLH
jgi:hypothetical protein